MKRCALVVALLFLLGWPPVLGAKMSTEEYQKQGDLLAELLISCRLVVAQSLIKYEVNNAELGDKGWTSEIFGQDVNTHFKEKTGIDILAGATASPLPGNTMELLKGFLDAAKKVQEENQPLINRKGLAFKGLTPAILGRAAGDLFKEKTGITLKQTTMILRNAYNAPDDFEKTVLAKMAEPDYPKGKGYFEQAGGQYRTMKPIYILKTCLPCHGEPKGEIDVAGRKKEGYKEGDFRGAISVAIPE